MSQLKFVKPAAPLTLAVIAERIGVELPAGVNGALALRGIAPLDLSGPGDITTYAAGDDPDDLAATRASVCLVAPAHTALVPSGTVALATADPGRAFRELAALLHPDAIRPGVVHEGLGIDAKANVHPDARLEAGVVIDPGVVVGPRAQIGSGTIIGANSVIGADVRIGRGCAIDVHVAIRHALIGDGVVIHAGAQLGVDGPDFGRNRDLKAPRVGRVIVQDGVEIGAAAIIERGTLGDTMIGDLTRIGPSIRIATGARIDRCASVDGPTFPSAAK